MAGHCGLPRGNRRRRTAQRPSPLTSSTEALVSFDGRTHLFLSRANHCECALLQDPRILLGDLRFHPNSFLHGVLTLHSEGDLKQAPPLSSGRPDRVDNTRLFPGLP